MGQQEYDFFATGAPTPVPPPAPSGPAQRRPQFTDPSGRAVNQFGTPVDVGAAPAGPAAAPGYGAQVFQGHGLTEVAGPGHLAPPGSHRVVGSDRPGQVLAAGIVGIVQGALALVVALFGLLALATLERVATDASADLVVSEVSGVVRLILLLVMLLAALYLVAGIATATGRRWGAWTLLVVESVGLLLGLVGLLDPDAQSGGVLGQLLGLAVPVAVLVLLLVPVSRSWLLRR